LFDLYLWDTYVLLESPNLAVQFLCVRWRLRQRFGFNQHFGCRHYLWIE
jgi:hypothetical protein